ncbi:MAG: TraB/GumN family protein [Pseudomonadota bacterium]
MSPVPSRFIRCLALPALFCLAACAVSTPASTVPERPGLATPPSEKPDITKTAIVTALEAAQRSRGGGEPAMWRYGDDNTTVYLFASLPMSDTGLEWRSPTINTAIESADQLIFETDTLSASAEAKRQRIINDKGLFRDGRLLSDVLTDPVKVRLRSAAARLEIPYAALESFKPWLVARQMNITAAQASGLQSGSDIERALIEEGRSKSKSISYLGDVSDRLNALGDLPLASQIDRLTVTTIATELTPNPQTVLQSEWLDGDVTGLTLLAANPLFHGGNETYERVVARQNRAYATKLKALLDEPETVFVVLSAASILGPDGVIAHLQADGIAVSRP